MLGSGFVCDFYMQALRYVPDQRVVVNFSKSQAKAEDFAQRWKVPESTTDMQAAIERDDVDLVVVGLPNFVHRDACIAAAEAGKAVVCTKPLGRNAPEAAEILQAVRAHGVFHGYLETEAFMPDVLRAKQAVQDGAIGKVLIVRAREAHTGSHATYAWDAATSGGGPLLGMGVHAVAACRLFIGKDVMPQEVMCWADTLEHDVPFEDNAVALVRFENRSLGQVESGWSNHGGMDVRTEIYGTDGLIHIDATHGVPIKAFSLHSMGYVQEKADSDTGWTYPQSDEAWQYGYHGQMYHFVRCLEDGTPADEDLRRRLHIQRRHRRRLPQRQIKAMGSGGPVGISGEWLVASGWLTRSQGGDVALWAWVRVNSIHPGRDPRRSNAYTGVGT